MGHHVSHGCASWLAIGCASCEKSFDYTTLGVAKQRIEYDNGTVSVANRSHCRAYEAKLLPAKDVPKRWEDLLDPKWKGKIGVINSTHHWGRLAAGAWGDEKTLDLFIKKLSAQKPLLTRAGEMAQRLILGRLWCQRPCRTASCTKRRNPARRWPSPRRSRRWSRLNITSVC